MNYRKLCFRFVYGGFSLILILIILVWAVNFYPEDLQEGPVICPNTSRTLVSGQKIKILTYNIQFMAGKKYFFFFEGGPDSRPSFEDVTLTTGKVAEVIRDEGPDIILLQEVDDGAKRTQYEDQLAELLSLLPEEYSCHTSAFYWKSVYVPHPKIMGAVGMKLSIISKYRIDNAIRYQLPLLPANIVYQQFNVKRAILEARLPVQNGKELFVLNTHLHAFAHGTDIIEKQIDQIEDILGRLGRNGNPWILGGDFNLLPPGQYQFLPQELKPYCNPITELTPLYERYNAVIPDFREISREEHERWLTTNPNSPDYNKPLASIDNIFFSKDIELFDRYVRQHDTASISDHLPVVAEITIP